MRWTQPSFFAFRIPIATTEYIYLDKQNNRHLLQTAGQTKKHVNNKLKTKYFLDKPCGQREYRQRTPVHWPAARKTNIPALSVDQPKKHRWSTSHCVLPSRFIGICMFVLLGGLSSDIISMPWRVQRTLVSWSNCSVGVSSGPTPPGSSALCPDRTCT